MAKKAAKKGPSKTKAATVKKKAAVREKTKAGGAATAGSAKAKKKAAAVKKKATAKTKTAARPAVKKVAKKTVTKKAATKKAAVEKTISKPAVKKKAAGSTTTTVKKPSAPKSKAKPTPEPNKKPARTTKTATASASGKSAQKMTPFLKRQQQKLLDLRDLLLDQMTGVAKDALRSRAEGSEASAFGMHQADAGSDAYDRDFALNLISKEQDALYEIEEALKRIEQGTYGICEVSGDKIPVERLEAIPFARLTVRCQEELENQEFGGNFRQPVTSLFGLMDSNAKGGGDDEEED